MTRRHVHRGAGFLSLSAFLSVIGCSDGEQSAPVVTVTPTSTQEISVPLFYTQETRDFVRAASDAFNRVRNTVGDGAIVKLSPTSAEGAEMHTFLEQHPTESFLWLTPSTMQAQGSKADLELGKMEQDACESLFFTTPTFAFRSIDSFAFGSQEQPPDLSMFLEQSEGSNIPEPTLVTGHPLLSPSGPAALAMLASAASGLPYSDLKTDTLAAHQEKLTRLRKRVVHQFADDQRMLEWLASRDGGLPILALTTRQQLRAFSKRFPQAKLREIVAPQSPFDLDFPLCIFESSQSPAQSQQAVRLARGFLMSTHVVGITEAAGFSDKRPGRPTSEQISQPSLAELVRSQSTVKQESWTSIVIDSSVAVEHSLLDSIRKLISQRLLTTAPLTVWTSIVSCSTRPELLARSTRTPKVIAEGLEKLRVSGGFAFGDCVLSAIDSAGETDVQGKRKTIIVLTRGRQTSNVVALNELKQIVPQRLNRNQTLLYVVSIENMVGENAAFDAQARSLGAVVVPTTPSRLSDIVTQLLAELS